MMAKHTNLDMDVLRTFTLGFELGSFARAADRLGRSQSAVSGQLRKLEEQIGLPLVEKAGRGLVPTAAGENLLSYAKRILDLNDEAVARVQGGDVEGWVRLGLAQDFSETSLPAVLGQFSRAHPKVRIEVQVDHSVRLLDKTLRGELDIALVWGDGADAPRGRRVGDFPVAWIGAPSWAGVADGHGEPLPLLFFESPCAFRSAGIAALDEAGIAWRIAFTSPSLSGLWAAAEAGLGLTLRTPIGMPSTLTTYGPDAGLPPLPAMPLALHAADAEPSAAASILADILLDTIRDRIPSHSSAMPLASMLV